jgi:NTP pyrophosphatase (non-canonical NTP hydrolase)
MDTTTSINEILSRSPKLICSIKLDAEGVKIIRYNNKINRFMGIIHDEIIVPDIRINNNNKDTDVDFHSYTAYCEKGFNENPMDDDMLDLLNAASGLAEEANELMGVVRKFVFHSKPFSLSEFADEAGDVTWFLANLFRLVGIRLSDVLMANKIKLDYRYPDGRNKNYKFNNRDKQQEKKLIKKLLIESGAYDKYDKHK